MTATQVFLRFAKENSCYSILIKCSQEAFRNCGYRDFKDDDFYSLAEMHRNEKIAIDKLLKIKHYSLSDIMFILHCNSKTFRDKMLYIKLSKKWHKYLKEDIDKNYKKVMILDSVNEFDGLGYRNGHYALNFNFKVKD